jgi:cation transport ATPase
MAKKKSYKKKPEEIISSVKMKEKHHVYHKHSQKVFNSISLVVIALASVITTAVTMPFILFFNSYLMYLFVLLVGTIFGFIFSFMVTDLKHLEKEGHLLLSITIPIISIVNILIMIYMLKHLTLKFEIPFEHNPIILSALYLLGYVIPYLFFSLLQYVQVRKK